MHAVEHCMHESMYIYKFIEYKVFKWYIYICNLSEMAETMATNHHTTLNVYHVLLTDMHVTKHAVPCNIT